MTAATKATEYPSAVAKARFVRVSPRKARRVIDLVRGRSVSDALDILRWAPQAAAALPRGASADHVIRYKGPESGARH